MLSFENQCLRISSRHLSYRSGKIWPIDIKAHVRQDSEELQYLSIWWGGNKKGKKLCRKEKNTFPKVYLVRAPHSPWHYFKPHLTSLESALGVDSPAFVECPWPRSPDQRMQLVLLALVCNWGKDNSLTSGGHYCQPADGSLWLRPHNWLSSSFR